MNKAVTQELPGNWGWSTLGKICEKPQYGWTTKSSQEGKLHLLRTTDITSGQINWNTVPYCAIEPEDIKKYLIKDGDIVVSRAGSVGVSSLITKPEPSIFASYLIRFKPLINKKYVYYYLQSPAYWNAISEKSAGIALQNVNATKLREIQIPIAPPEQQKRIVAQIEELFSHMDAGIKALQKAKQLLKQYRQSILKAAVTGELTKEWREANKDKLEPASLLLQRILKERRRKWEEQQLEKFKAKGKVPKNDKWKEKYKEPITPTLKGLGELPTDWTWGGIEEVTSHIVDCLHSTAKFTESGKYCIDTNCLEEGYIPFNKARFVSEEIFEERVRRLKPMEGDILFSREGTIGLAALVPANTELCLGQRMMMFRSDIILPEYFMWALLSPVFIAQWKPRVMGTTAPHVNIGDIRIMALPLPPIEEQNKIVRQIETKFNFAKRVETEIDLQILQAGKSKQSALVAAFTGNYQ